MTTSYPGGFDAFAAPGTNLSSTPNHDDMHIDVQDAVEAIQAELGLNPRGSSASVAARLAALGTVVSFTPVWTNLTVGNGVPVGRYCQIGKRVDVNIELTIGTTTSIVGSVGVAAPVGTPSRVSTLGVTYEDQGTRYYTGSAVNIATLGRFEIVHSESGNQGLMNATSPFTFVAGDDLVISGFYFLP